MIDDLLRNAEGHRADGDLAAPPALKLAIVTCMDARIDPAALLGLRPGDAHVIRNAGGVVTDDVLRSLTLSQALLGTREVMVIQHTSCGLNGDEDELRASVREATGEDPGHLHAFTDVEESVRASVRRLGEGARGFVYEVETGRLREVTP
jgi:carbonic anhydrase